MDHDHVGVVCESNPAGFVASATLGKLFAALSKAQAEMQGAKTDRENKHFDYRYATLRTSWEACRECLTGNGLSVVQIPTMGVDELHLISILGHASGEFLGGGVSCAIPRGKPQELVKATTYLRRNGLQALTGIYPGDDDDGESSREWDSGASVMPHSTSRPPAASHQLDYSTVGGCLSEWMQHFSVIDIKEVIPTFLGKFGVARLKDLEQDRWGELVRDIAGKYPANGGMPPKITEALTRVP